MTKTCDHCGNPYQGRRTHRSQRYCSIQCAGMAKKQSVPPGTRYGRLTVLEIIGRTSPYEARVRCDCGSVKVVKKHSLTSGVTRSCGCLKAEAAAVSRPRTHGMSNSPEYRIYRSAKNRCLRKKNRDFATYGGRGIKFEFPSFEAFYAALGPRPSDAYTLERNDVNGPYSASNCSWVPAKDQYLNKRNTRKTLFRGEMRTVAEIAEMSTLPKTAIKQRILKAGWCGECAATLPLDKQARGCPHRPP